MVKIKVGNRFRDTLVALLGLCALVITVMTTAGPALAARYASIIVDAETGKVLHEQNADDRNYPASLTKIMTLYMVFDALRAGKLTMESKFRVSKRASGQAPSRLGLRAGDTISVRDCILALVTKSANDVAATVAENMAGTEIRFAIAMTEKARALGMKRTSFRNASGLPNRRQKSTARDMATLALAMRRDFPDYFHFFSTENFRYAGRVHENHNNLLGRYRGTNGIKTGYIRASGFNLVASVERHGHQLIGVVFGGKSARSRDAHMVSLFDKGFTKVVRTAMRESPPMPVKRPAFDDTGDVKTAANDDSGDKVRDWGIQVGAYSAAVPAERMIRAARGHLPDLLDEVTANIERVRRPHGTIFRARMVGLSEDDAREACSMLTRRHLPCVPVPAREREAVAFAPE